MIEREGQRDVIMLGLDLDSRGGENDGRVSLFTRKREERGQRVKRPFCMLWTLSSNVLIFFTCGWEGELSRFCSRSPYIIYSLLLITYFCFGSD